jgi:hypothetical protein
VVEVKSGAAPLGAVPACLQECFYSDCGGVRRRLVRVLRVERVLLVDELDRGLRRPVPPLVLAVRRRRVVGAPETALCTRR